MATTARYRNYTEEGSQIQDPGPQPGKPTLEGFLVGIFVYELSPV